MSDTSGLPSNPAERKKLKDRLVEMTNCMRTIDDEREQMGDIAKTVEAEFGLKKKLFRKLASTMYKHNYQSVAEENSHFEFLYEALVEGKKTDNNEEAA